MQERLNEGYPVPIQCGWNGLAVLNPAPFRKHGLRFRYGWVWLGVAGSGWVWLGMVVL